LIGAENISILFTRHKESSAPYNREKSSRKQRFDLVVERKCYGPLWGDRVTVLETEERSIPIYLVDRVPL
jgi:hypothetical protein